MVTPRWRLSSQSRRAENYKKICDYSKVYYICIRLEQNLPNVMRISMSYPMTEMKLRDPKVNCKI